MLCVIDLEKAGRVGLVAKKVQVTRGRQTYLTTVYVRGNLRQANDILSLEHEKLVNRYKKIRGEWELEKISETNFNSYIKDVTTHLQQAIKINKELKYLQSVIDEADADFNNDKVMAAMGKLEYVLMHIHAYIRGETSIFKL